jgi:hypothetical protein
MVLHHGNRNTDETVVVKDIKIVANTSETGLQ